MIRRLLLCFPILLLLAASAPQRIVVIGDSTVSYYRPSTYYPQTGWGQVLQLYFQSGTVVVDDQAAAGRSSRSFIEDGHWATVKAGLQAGDILLIQFGHNDRDYSNSTRYTDTNGYKQYLSQYAREARALGVMPVFVTPMNMNTWTNATTVREVFCEFSRGADYRGAMLRVGDSLHVPVLDLEKKSKALMDTMGQTYMARFHFLGLDTGEYPLFPNGVSDGTHFQEVGGLENARMVAEEISRLAGDTSLARLAPLRAKLYPVTVITNDASGGTISRTRSYPPGATVTLKGKPSAGKTFLGWMSGDGRYATTELRHTFVQPEAASIWQAVWSGTNPLPMSSSGAQPSSSSSVVVPSSSSVVQSVDCAGDAGGSATVDACGRCMGGSTGESACGGFVEGEDACFSDGIVETLNAGFLGFGYLNFANADSAAATFAIASPGDVATDLYVRYANGTTATRAMRIFLDDSVLADSVLFPGLGSWTTWGGVGLNLQMSAGTHRIRMVALTGDGGPNLDLLGWSTPLLSVGACSEPLLLQTIQRKKATVWSPELRFRLDGRRVR